MTGNTIHDLQQAYPLYRLRGEKSTHTTDVVAIERTLDLWVDGVKRMTFSCSPAEEEALVLGYLKNEGSIQHRGDVTSLHIEGRAAEVRLDPGRRKARPEGFAPLCSAPPPTPGDIQKIFSDMQTHMALFEATGGVHSGALYRDDQLVAFATDVARHNVLDKLCGKMLLAGESPRGLTLAFTGRQAAEIVRKAVAMQVGILAGISAPTSGGVDLAEENGLTLIGFVRPGRMNVYTHPEGIDLKGDMSAAKKKAIQPRVITITAQASGSGKTTLIEKLIPVFLTRGLQVGVFKRSTHSFSRGQEMKDTDRYRVAGATAVFFDSPGEQVILREAGSTDLWATARHEKGLDLLILESRRGREGRVYEVIRGRDAAEAFRDKAPEGVHRIITDVPECFPGENTLPLNDPEGCVEGILMDLERLRKGENRGADMQHKKML